ncbi:MAG: ComEA family DNA-binding protein [Chloroflexi bacterium]|nr:ComEA family DNA-binding protein [Chloroflexota bacterium]
MSISQGSGERRLNLAIWIVISLLIIALVAGGAVLISRHVGGGSGGNIEVILPAHSQAEVEVYLSGAVTSEGIYTFSQDSSLKDVLQRAGIVGEGSDPIKVKIRVLDTYEDPFAEEEQGTKTNINTASAAQLELLKGIGPVKAQAIINYRNEHGFFRSVDELLNVPGIGPKTLAAIRDQVTVVD